MDKYEYVIVFYSEEINKRGREGWRVIPGIMLGENKESIMMERLIVEEPKTEETRALGDGVITLCGKRKAGGWGQMVNICNFDEGHEKQGIPHSWVIQ